MTRRTVIVGGGSAGCVLAARLSEDPANTVVLVEAGPDYPTTQEMAKAAPELLDADRIGVPTHDWGYASTDEVERADGSPLFGLVERGVVPVLRGKVIGGSSAVNGANALRPTPEDFARWTGLGNDEWSWDQVLPYLRKFEDDPAGAADNDHLHGTGGPVHITRFTEDDGLLPIGSAFLEACAQAGHPVHQDMNGAERLGAGPLPLNRRDGVRQSTAVSYLAAARGRANLTVLGERTVDRVEFAADGTTARAVLLADGTRIEGDVIVLAAGSLGSPAILMRSGIGPRRVLDELSIPVVRALEGVGRNLRDHSMVYLTYAVDEEAVGAITPPLQTVLTLPAGGAGQGREVDLHAVTLTMEPGELLIPFVLYRPYSLGSMEITSRDPDTAPRIHLGLFDHPDDLRRMISGIREMRKVMEAAPLRPFVKAETWPGPEATTDADLARAVHEGKNTCCHAVGTCAMGGADTPTAVVDQRGKVHGVDGLYVIDASIMPDIPAEPTNTTVMVMAERCADELRRNA
ncbi:GMC family oxidoreductase [Streptomyces endophyticus]|uniref:GMC family oxidoreductase n=1 Tax=Streptomyces endophyticus TaxID=714166 RepID=A0ABU6FBI7_9ACTN|nr:GMC family oxidoreductase [Streptomyces endophyticus]MEB8340216.1 GMC family oxidoreductase [Streptomyces endophyticus]